MMAPIARIGKGCDAEDQKVLFGWLEGWRQRQGSRQARHCLTAGVFEVQREVAFNVMPGMLRFAIRSDCSPAGEASSLKDEGGPEDPPRRGFPDRGSPQACREPPAIFVFGRPAAFLAVPAIGAESPPEFSRASSLMLVSASSVSFSSVSFSSFRVSSRSSTVSSRPQQLRMSARGPVA